MCEALVWVRCLAYQVALVADPAAVLNIADDSALVCVFWAEAKLGNTALDPMPSASLCDSLLVHFLGTR